VYDTPLHVIVTFSEWL